jgi:hypothetical protein
MYKYEEMAQPDSCFNRAMRYERMFVLLGRDDCAPAAIRAWVRARIELGKNRPNDPQIVDALDCAAAMELEYSTVRSAISGGRQLNRDYLAGRNTPLGPGE